METATPSSSRIFSSLLRADLIVQWRNRRAAGMSLFVPIIILVSWQSIVAAMGGPFAISSCITIGLAAVGLMGFANTTATHRGKGVFQRLRVTPASTLQIMASRIAVQLVQIAAMTIAVFIAAYLLDKITLSVGGYIAAFFASLCCGAVFLSMALALVGLIARAETVNAVTRFVYIALVIVGAVGELGVLGNIIKDIVLWSPYGTVKVVLLASMTPSTWSMNATLALGATVLYAILFAFIGIRWFKWDSGN
jgi:ABC-2 type transport system permease protein